MSAGGALTVRLLSRDGHFTLVDDTGAIVGGGIAQPSSRPGYVTLRVLESKRPMAPVLRVPADWVSTAERL